MTDIKTEIGKSRAFIRLALERKLLSKHLRTLLSNQQLTCAFYKRYAFLRSDDEKGKLLCKLRHFIYQSFNYKSSIIRIIRVLIHYFF